MKNALSLILVLGVLLMVLAGCGSGPEADTSAATSNTDESLVEVEENSEDESPVEPVSYEEAVRLLKEDLYQEIPGWSKGTEDDGYIINEETHDSYNLHYVGELLDGNIYQDDRGSFYFNEGQLTCWSFGEKKTIQLDGEYVYCGSQWQRLIFRKGDKVFGISNDLEEITLLAEGVKFVITTNYRHNSDLISILFQMEDGSLKATGFDDELLKLCYEGGYGGTYIGDVE